MGLICNGLGETNTLSVSKIGSEINNTRSSPTNASRHWR